MGSSFMTHNRIDQDVAKLLDGFEERVWALAEAHEQAMRAVDFRERGDDRLARMCDDAARAALRRAIELERHMPRAANDSSDSFEY